MSEDTADDELDDDFEEDLEDFEDDDDILDEDNGSEGTETKNKDNEHYRESTFFRGL